VKLWSPLVAGVKLNQRSWLFPQLREELAHCESLGSGELDVAKDVSNEFAPRFAGIALEHSSPLVCPYATPPTQATNRNAIETNLVIFLLQNY
jgi:hypothetical protein